MVRSDGRQDDRLESLELEFNLLKTEIRQTLIDVKEFVMKGRSVNPPARPQAPPIPVEMPTNEVVVEPNPIDLARKRAQSGSHLSHRRLQVGNQDLR